MHNKNERKNECLKMRGESLSLFPIEYDSLYFK